jgi:hypothetical protein
MGIVRVQMDNHSMLMSTEDISQEKKNMQSDNFLTGTYTEDLYFKCKIFKCIECSRLHHQTASTKLVYFNVLSLRQHGVHHQRNTVTL